MKCFSTDSTATSNAAQFPGVARQRLAWTYFKPRQWYIACLPSGRAATHIRTPGGCQWHHPWPQSPNKSSVEAHLYISALSKLQLAEWILKQPNQVFIFCWILRLIHFELKLVDNISVLCSNTIQSIVVRQLVLGYLNGLVGHQIKCSNRTRRKFERFKIYFLPL